MAGECHLIGSIYETLKIGIFWMHLIIENGFHSPKYNLKSILELKNWLFEMGSILLLNKANQTSLKTGSQQTYWFDRDWLGLFFFSKCPIIFRHMSTLFFSPWFWACLCKKMNDYLRCSYECKLADKQKFAIMLVCVSCKYEGK